MGPEWRRYKLMKTFHLLSSHNTNHRHTRTRYCCVLAALISLILGFGRPLHAQVVGATLLGTVADPSGAVVPGTKIAIQNTATNVIREVTTDPSGFYTAPNLLPGDYEVTASATGFSTLIRKDITLTIGATQVLNMRLQIGQSIEKVEVTGAPPSVQLSSAAISAEVTGTTMRQLPLNGRDWTQLATLQPGIAASSTQASVGASANRGNRGFGNELTNSGHRPTENNYRIDGININEYTNSAPGSVLGVNLGVDALQEFSVLTSNYGAEYGRVSGAVINAITKSGTNSFHGAAYWFLRDEDFDARNYFDTTVIPPFHRNNFGVSGGGPIRKERTFIFGDYEGIRQSLSNTFRDLAPSQDARNGILHNADGTTTTIAVDPKVSPYLAFWPVPSTKDLIAPGNTGFISLSGVSQAAENYATIRVDQIFSDKDTLSGTYFFDRTPTTAPDALVLSLNNVFTQRQMGEMTESHIFSPTLLNTFRVGVNRSVALINTPDSAINPIAGETQLGTFTGLAAPNLIVPGLTSMSGSLGSAFNTKYWYTTIQLYDDAFVTRGTHSLKFGLGIERDAENSKWRTFPTGKFQFPSLQGFLSNTPTFFQGANPSVAGEVGLVNSLIGTYVQDDWKLSSNLTLNLGVRYEFSTIPRSANAPLLIVQNLYGGLPVSTQTAWEHNATKDDFEPRVGFSWDPFRTDKTAIRGGFGVYTVLPISQTVLGEFPSELPFQAQSSVSLVGQPAGATFPTGVLSLISFNPSNPDFSTLRVPYDTTSPPRSYAMNFNLNVQRDLGWDTSLMIGYVGQHSVHMPVATDDSNGVQGSLTSAGWLWPYPVGSGTKLNPNVGQISARFWDNSVSYNSLQVQGTKRMNHGLQFQGAYTWSRCVDYGSGGLFSDFYLNSLDSLPFYARSVRRGNCDFDLRTNFVFSYVLDLPAPTFGGPLAKQTLGGWELTGIVNVRSGAPFTPLMGGNPLGSQNATPIDFPDRLNTPGCQNVTNGRNVNNYLKLNCFTPPTAPSSFATVCQPAAPSVSALIPNTCMNLMGNVGRNSIYGPGLTNMDFAISTNVKLCKLLGAQSVSYTHLTL